MTEQLKLDRTVRDMALEEAAQIADANGGGDAAAVIRAHKAGPFTRATPLDLQRALGNSQAGHQVPLAPLRRSA